VDEKASFLEHLEELRRRLIAIFLSLTITTSISFLFSDNILSFLKSCAGEIRLSYFSPLEPIMVKIKLAIFFGAFLASPVILHQALAFILPAATPKEKRMLIPVVLSSFILFLVGVMIGFYLILPYGLKWLFLQAGDQIEQVLRAEFYISFVGWLLLISGLIFETPLLIVSLVKARILSYKQLRRKWQFVYLGILVISAIITPDWSPVTMVILAIPILLLYEVSLFAARFFE
jgi:sec-independent protein translocase protein TatC